MALGEPLTQAIVTGAGEVGVPTMLSTLCICIVFVPIFLLQGTAKYLFSPLSLSVCVSLVASLALSFTLVPVLFKYLMRSSVEAHGAHGAAPAPPASSWNPFTRIHRGFDHGFTSFREGYRNSVSWALSQPVVTVAFFVVLMACSLLLFPELGRDFFPQVDAGQMRLHVRAPPGTRIEQTQHYFADVEAAIRQIVGNDQIDTMLDNIGLPYSGINIALSDSATVGPMDGEILISLKPKHTPTGRACRRSPPRAAQALPRPAILLSARRYRRSGAEFRPARADRHARFRTEQYRSLCARRQDRARSQPGAGRGRFACLPGARRSRPHRRCRPHDGGAGRLEPGADRE